MRSLVQPRVLRSAGLAAFITTLAGYPRLAFWTDRPYQLWFMLLTLAWAAFILWSFVFAWHRTCPNRDWVLPKTAPRLWGIATLGGLAGAFLLHLFIDPVLRAVSPEDYPSTIQSWAAMSLFVLAFDQLFLCFAPFAFFVRLVQNRRAAVWMTLLFGVFLVALKTNSLREHFSRLFILELFLWRFAAGSLSLYLYLSGGAALTLWWILLLQLRHLVWW